MPMPARFRQAGQLGGDGEVDLNPGVVEEGQLVLECGLPINHVLVEMGSVAVFARMLELIERTIFGVEQAAVL